MTPPRALAAAVTLAFCSAAARASCPQGPAAASFPNARPGSLLVVRLGGLGEDEALAALRQGAAGVLELPGRKGKGPVCAPLTEALARAEKTAGGPIVLVFPASARLDGLGPRAHLAAADAALALGDRRAELWHAEQAALFEPRRAELWVRIARLRSELGSGRAAEAAYRRALALDPASVPLAEGFLVFGPDFKPRPGGPAVADQGRTP